MFYVIGSQDENELLLSRSVKICNFTLTDRDRYLNRIILVF